MRKDCVATVFYDQKTRDAFYRVFSIAGYHWVSGYPLTDFVPDMPDPDYDSLILFFDSKGMMRRPTEDMEIVSNATFLSHLKVSVDYENSFVDPRKSDQF